MKKRNTLLIVLLALIFFAFAFTVTDRILFENNQSPIFAIKQQGGECVSYRGICYEVLEFYPLLSMEEESSDYDSMEWYWLWE